MEIEDVKQKFETIEFERQQHLSLIERKRINAAYYSTVLEGNKLDIDQVQSVLCNQVHFPGREIAENEVKGYFLSLSKIHEWAAKGLAISEDQIKILHGLNLSDGDEGFQVPASYRDSALAMRPSAHGDIPYMAPDPLDVPDLMKELVTWITENHHLPCPIVAAIVQHQFAAIQPYFQSNGTTARLLSNFVLHLGGYDLKGLLCLESEFAKNPNRYFETLTANGAQNFYMEVADADITPWIEYFTQAMATCSNTLLMATDGAEPNRSAKCHELIRKLDLRQRKALELFRDYEAITSRQIGELFDLKPRTSSQICSTWAADGFFRIVGPSNKGRKYHLAKEYEDLIILKE